MANGVLFAGFISGDVPTGHFNYFSSRVISGQGMLTLGTPMLLKVLNAAIAQVQRAGTPPLSRILFFMVWCSGFLRISVLQISGGTGIWNEWLLITC